MSLSFDAIGQLKKYAKSQVSGFSQAQDGMCYGMCLDWIRRVLKSVKLARPVATYQKADLSGPAATQDFNKTEARHGRRLEKITHLQTLAEKHMVREIDADGLAEARKVSYGSFQASFLKTYDAVSKPLYAKKTGHFSFDAIVGIITPDIYEFMSLDDHTEDDVPPIDWEKFKVHLARKLVVGRCYLVGCQGDGPHSIALFKEANDLYRLFEPNFGEFVITGDNLFPCLHDLLTENYGCTVVSIDEFHLAS